MPKTVISVENLSKSYRLGQIGTGTLTRDLEVWWAKVRGKPNPLLKIGQTDHGNKDGETLWALNDVSFQIQQGEVLGIIGRNGAGKSTLLKILSRVTAPTSGQIKVKGRIASLLEVGTGFHPELTGRENIFLNGAILGMSKQEVQRKFDEIVSFAEVEKFVDTPVKRYSSGMYVRLAFAVAAHLESEILLVDEVLAVGDAEFQKKCLGKMGDVATNEGRTVLFVSHNMSNIQTLTNKCLVIDKGKLCMNGLTKDSIEYYLSSYKTLINYDVSQIPRKRYPAGEKVRILEIRPVYIKEVGFYLYDPLEFSLKLHSKENMKNLSIGVTISDIAGGEILSAMSDKVLYLSVSEEFMNFSVKLENTRLSPGNYQLGLSVFIGSANEGRKTLDVVNPAIDFQIAPFDIEGASLMDWKKSYGPIIHKDICVEKLEY